MPIEIKNSANGDLELLIYGVIGANWWGDGNDAKEFANKLMTSKANVLNIRINSPGGDLFAGHAIYNSIRQFKGTKRTYIDGLAASAASIIAMAGDEVIMPANSMLMIHNTFMGMYGDNNDFARAAEDLTKFNQTVIAVYQNKTGLPEDEIKNMMDSETWLTAKEAKELGFATSIVDEIKLVAQVDGKKVAINGVNFGDIPIGQLWSNCKFELFAKFDHPESIPNRSVLPNAPNNQDNPLNIKRSAAMPMTTVEALQKDHPEIYDALVAQAKKEGYESGIKAERDRIHAIEKLDMPGHKELIAKAKFETGITAEQTAMMIVTAEAEQRRNYAANATQDAAPLKNIQALPTEPAQTQNEGSSEFWNTFTNAVNKGIKHAAD